jgi:hypothetical protein
MLDVDNDLELIIGKWIIGIGVMAVIGILLASSS